MPANWTQPGRLKKCPCQSALLLMSLSLCSEAAPITVRGATPPLISLHWAVNVARLSAGNKSNITQKVLFRYKCNTKLPNLFILTERRCVVIIIPDLIVCRNAGCPDLGFWRIPQSL